MIPAMIFGGKGDQAVGGVGIASVAAATFRAACNWPGNSLPRFSARRRIPAQAFGLKKYRCGRSPVSKTSDNEDATAPLWNSEVLSVKNPVGEPIPALPQEIEERGKSPASVNREYSWDIFPYHPARTEPYKERNELYGECSSLSINTFAKSGDAKVLAGRAGAYKVNGSIVAFLYRGKVAVARYVWVVVRQHGAGERFYF